ncbi:MAG: hypothetical protein NTY35_17075 [Planctomycetota bacterium]|nr:hypothetical protein [Planctomycetota bacterium]
MNTPGHRSATWTAAEGRGAFGGFIGPRNLVELVQSSAPWLFDGTHPLARNLPDPRPGRLVDLGEHPLGWWTILLAADRLAATDRPTPEDIADYFALSCACHFASVATYVPTDVDAKIRRALWIDQTDPRELARMHAFALALAGWDVSGVSARIVQVEGLGPVSGHDGERLSVLCGALIGASNADDKDAAEAAARAIDAELAREARAFDLVRARHGEELRLLDLATVLTHNQGDVMQSLGTKEARCVPDAVRARFTDLARERFERYDGAFGSAARLYKELLSPEGHRHYPLREVKLLRASPALLLPIGPFLDAFGERLARHPAWSAAQRAEVVTGLLEGCRKVAGQEGYYRALCGFDAALPGGIAALEPHFATAARREWKADTTRKKLGVRRVSFESSYQKRARQVLQGG